MDFLEWPLWIRVHLSFSKMDSIAHSVGDKSGLINTGDATELLFARMLAASIARWSFTRIGLGLVCWDLNFPSLKQSSISMWTLMLANILETSLVSLTIWALLTVFWGHSSTPNTTILHLRSLGDTADLVGCLVMVLVVSAILLQSSSSWDWRLSILADKSDTAF